jgi:hypothetical protein
LNVARRGARRGLGDCLLLRRGLTAERPAQPSVDRLDLASGRGGVRAPSQNQAPEQRRQFGP